MRDLFRRHYCAPFTGFVQDLCYFADKRSALSVITYAIFGLMANLLTFTTPPQTGNALDGDDFTIPGAPLYCWAAWLGATAIAATFGLCDCPGQVVLCITRGDFARRRFRWFAVVGIGSGITAAFYVVLPRG